MTFPNLMYEFRSLAKRIPKIANVIDQRRLSSIAFDESDDAAAKMALMVELADQLWKMGMIQSKQRVLDKVERLPSLLSAVLKIALPLRGGRVFSEDTFKTAVERACDPAHREYWTLESGGLMAALLHEHPEIAEELMREHGILCWDVLDTDPVDRNIRIVNSRWLVDEADIYSFVVNKSATGKFCRFCCALEPPESFELQAVNAQERNLDVLLSDGRRSQLLQQGVVYVHARCEEFWLQWLNIASQLERDTAA